MQVKHKLFGVAMLGVSASFGTPAHAQCDVHQSYVAASVTGAPETRSSQFMRQWRDRVDVELSRADLAHECRFVLLRDALGLSNGMADYQDGLLRAQAMRAEAQKDDERIEAANAVVAQHVQMYHRDLPAAAQDECVRVATDAIALVPAGAGVLEPQWGTSFSYVLTLRHVVATGRADATEGRVARLEALVGSLQELRGSSTPLPSNAARLTG